MPDYLIGVGLSFTFFGFYGVCARHWAHNEGYLIDNNFDYLLFAVFLYLKID